MTAGRVPYAGIATRAVALTIDAAAVQLIALTGGAMFAIVGSLVGGVQLDTAGKVVAFAAWLAVVGVYFVLFWSTAGQTPGMRLMHLRVVTYTGEHPGVGRSMLRLVGLGLAIAPLFAGFLPVLVDERRRALQDLIARTVVVYEDGELVTYAQPADAPAPVKAPTQVGATRRASSP